MMAACKRIMVDTVVVDCLKPFNLERLKKEQMEILECLLDHRDCMAVLPTGYGKSLPYQIFTAVVRKLNDPRFDDDCKSKIIVCSPLVALMEEQVHRLDGKNGICAAVLGGSQDIDKMTSTDVIFASPEVLLGDSQCRACIKSLPVAVIVIDEFHTIASWGGYGDVQEEEEVFRKWFRYVGELRSFHPKATVLALSATCTLKIQRRVMTVLNLSRASTRIIMTSPNRSNIKLLVHKMQNTVEEALHWIVESLQTLREKFPRTIIYANSINDVSKIYTLIRNEISEGHRLVDRYHSQTPEDSKQEIVASLSVSTSSKRIFVATSALGMGVDMSGFHSVILYGPSREFVDLVQAIGRVGRDNAPAVALILYNSMHLRKIDITMKELCVNNRKCRRLALMEQFLSQDLLSDIKASECGKHTCCDICADNCICGKCDTLTLEKLMFELHNHETFEDSNEHSESSSDSDCVHDESDVDDELTGMFVA